MKQFMTASDKTISEICNDIAQPVTVLNLTLQLIDQGEAQPGDVALMRAELERLSQLVHQLRASVDQQNGLIPPLSPHFKQTMAPKIIC